MSGGWSRGCTREDTVRNETAEDAVLVVEPWAREIAMAPGKSYVVRAQSSAERPVTRIFARRDDSDHAQATIAERIGRRSQAREPRGASRDRGLRVAPGDYLDAHLTSGPKPDACAAEPRDGVSCVTLLVAAWPR